MKRLGLFSALLALLFVPSAFASPFTPELRQDYHIAQRFWHAQPMQCSSIDFQVMRFKQLGSDEGETPWEWEEGYPHEEGAELSEEGEAPFGEATVTDRDFTVPCKLWVAHRIVYPLHPQLACMTVIHEYGHLLGHEHSSNQHSIMFPLLYLWNMPKVCKAKERR